MNKVLLIESNAQDAASISEYLSAHKYDVTTVDDGGVALQHLSHTPVDIIIMAAELPRSNGYSICNRLRKDATGQVVPLIIISANPAAESTFAQHQKLRTHADLYMKKPLNMEVLVREMRDLIRDNKEPPAPSRPASPPQRRLVSSTFSDIDELVGRATAIHKIPDIMLEKTTVQRPERTEKTQLAQRPNIARLLDEERTVTASIPDLSKLHDSQTTVSSISSVASGAGDSRLRKENQELKQKVKKLEDQLRNKELEFSDRLLAENSKGRELASAQKAQKALESKLAEKEEQYELLMQKLTQLAEKTKALIAERNDLAEQVQNLSAALEEHQAAGSDMANLEASLAAAQQQVADLNSEVSGMEDRLTDEQAKAEKAQKAVQLAMQLIRDGGFLEDLNP